MGKNPHFLGGDILPTTGMQIAEKLSGIHFKMADANIHGVIK